MSYSLYVHVPFCKRKCNYCDFPSYPGKEALVPDYLEALMSEIGYYSSLYDHPKINTVYIGGGTPTILSEDDVSSLFECIDRDFKLASGTEMTIEANPGTITKQKMRAIKKAGVNRVSLGAQTFNNKLLKRLGRIHMAHDIVDACSMIRDSGINNLNLDLIFALPGENLTDWKNTLEKAIELDPEHISTYNLQLEEGTPLYMEKLEGSLNLPGEEEELEMYKAAIDMLKNNGYSQYEISNFAREGYECSHNKAYWTMKDYIGIGAGAHSFIDGTRIENTAVIEKYLSGNFAQTKTEHRNTKKESMQETVFLGLRLMEGIDLNEFTKSFGVSFREIYKKEIDELASENLLEIRGRKARLTNKGLFLANEVFLKFL